MLFKESPEDPNLTSLVLLAFPQWTDIDPNPEQAPANWAALRATWDQLQPHHCAEQWFIACYGSGAIPTMKHNISRVSMKPKSCLIKNVQPKYTFLQSRASAMFWDCGRAKLGETMDIMPVSYYARC